MKALAAYRGGASGLAGEEAGKDPQTGQPDQGVDDTGRGVGLAEVEAEYLGNEIELGQGHQAPVDRADAG